MRRPCTRMDSRVSVRVRAIAPDHRARFASSCATLNGPSRGVDIPVSMISSRICRGGGRKMWGEPACLAKMIRRFLVVIASRFSIAHHDRGVVPSSSRFFEKYVSRYVFVARRQEFGSSFFVADNSKCHKASAYDPRGRRGPENSATIISDGLMVNDVHAPRSLTVSHRAKGDAIFSFRPRLYIMPHANVGFIRFRGEETVSHIGRERVARKEEERFRVVRQ